MEKLFENKMDQQLNNYFFYFFIWGYLYFSADYFTCKKIKKLFSNEFNTIVPCV